MSRFKFAVAEWCVPVAGPAICRMAAEAGYDGVELNLGEYEHNLPLTDPHVRRYYLDAQQKYAMGFAAIAVNALDKSFVMPPENEQRAQERRFIMRAAVDTAAALKIPIVQVPNFWQNGMKNASDIEIAAGFFRDACEAAEAHGIIVSSENPMSAEDNLRLFELVNRPNFRLYFDTENPVYFSKTNTADMLTKLIDKVCQIHVKDGTDEQMSCKLLGQGHAYFNECAKVIRESSYEGWIVVENNYDMPPFNTFENDRFELLAADARILRETFAEA